MMQQKRTPLPLGQSGYMDLIPKRTKNNDTPLSSKEKKEKFGEGITALQQLVSPYGKTDTASVLLGAIEYISFLHEQVKVLSAPYLYSTASIKPQDDGQPSLEAKGLCLVPISLTEGVAGSNGADIWAPMKTSPTGSKRSVFDEGSSVITYSQD